MIYNSFNNIYKLYIYIFFIIYIYILYIYQKFIVYIYSNFSYFFETKVRKTQLYQWTSLFCLFFPNP